MKKNILSLSIQELKDFLLSHEMAAYRLDQLLEWIYLRRCVDFNQMLNLSKDFRSLLAEHFTITYPEIEHREESSDGTVKYLIKLSDAKSIETVWIPRHDKNRYTVCVSTQVGCRMACRFCLTGQQKTERDLSAGEIVSQITLLPEAEKVSNVVVMGMGEPFDNYENLMESLYLMTHPKLLALAPRRITVSTSGLLPKIERFVQESKCRLAISLNASNEKTREYLMPINRAYSIADLMKLVRRISKPDFPKLRQRDFYVTFEYILIENVNDTEENARELLALVKGLPVKINLLLYNENPNVADLKRPSQIRVERFQQVLMQARVLNFVRKSRGRDISAACGQLASLEKNNSTNTKQVFSNA